jgi:cytochrome c oxidase cbb3-type subunit III
MRRGLIIGSCALALGLSMTAMTGCEREERQFRELPHMSGRSNLPVRLTDLQPGQPLPSRIGGGRYENNAYAMSEGKRLYQWYNCSGCHFQGGGGIGPPLMDDEWIYGSRPENIFETVVEGRPNGMPSFRGKLGNDQVWQLVAYVRSMSGLLPKDVASGRNDDMQVRSQEQITEKALPKQSVLPKSAEQP